MMVLEYKGFQGSIYTDDQGIFGRLINIREVVTFKGATFEEACQSFKDSVDDYLEFCQQS